MSLAIAEKKLQVGVIAVFKILHFIAGSTTFWGIVRSSELGVAKCLVISFFFFVKVVFGYVLATMPTLILVSF